ncbi:ribonuclease E/G [Peptoniphilus mikwangii]|nr:ribonuclease E/G [Peptoniphilus mikwangii]
MGKYYIDNDLKVAIYYDGKINRIQDLEESRIRDIYRGRVENIVHSMNAVFVNIGTENGYLNLEDIDGDIKVGDDILVQIKKIPEENKLVKLTMELSVDGKYIIYFPMEKFVKFSKNLNFEKKNELKKFAVKNNLRGVLFRTNANNAQTDEILEEYSELFDIGNKLIREKNLRPTPKLIYCKSGVEDFLRDNVVDEDVIINDIQLYNTYKNKYNLIYDKDFKIIYNREILEDYKKLFLKTVKLKSGANIVIEETAALSSIDVNTANFVGNLDFEDTIFKVNEEAAVEIARQIILRNISGIIIIDFIDMKTYSEKKKILKILQREFKKDFSRTVVYGFTKLNLVEISRKNLGVKLKNKLEV